MRPDLFGSLLERRRARLRLLGWREAAGLLRGVPMWRDPGSGAVLTEDEAMKWLDRNELEAQRREGPVSCEGEE